MPSVDAVALLANDHRAVEAMFRNLVPGSAASGSSSGTPDIDRGTVVGQIIEELSRHAEIEEEHLYPAIREHVPDGDDLADHAEEEHAQVKEMLDQLEGMDPNSREAEELLQELRQSVEEHFQEEEAPDGLFAQVRSAMDSESLQELGSQLAEAKLRRTVDMDTPVEDTIYPKEKGGAMFGP